MNKQLSSLPELSPGDLDGQVAIVTGGGRGIGAATARLFRSLGAEVVIVCRTESEMRAQLANGIYGICLDLSRPESIDELLNFTELKTGKVATLLVNNAAIGYSTPYVESTSEKILEEWKKIQAINIQAPLLLSHGFMQRLINHDLKGKSAAIVNISSLGGVSGTEKFKGLALYVTSKAAVIGMTEALAVEGRSICVRVNAVAPGAVDTEMLKKAAPHLKTETKPEAIAHIIASLCNPKSKLEDSGKTIEVHSNL